MSTLDLSRLDAFLANHTGMIPGARLAARPYRCNLDGRAIRTRAGKVATYASLDQACKAGKAALRKAMATEGKITLTLAEGRNIRNTLENFRTAHRSANVDASIAKSLADTAYETSSDALRVLANVLP